VFKIGYGPKHLNVERTAFVAETTDSLTLRHEEVAESLPRPAAVAAKVRTSRPSGWQEAPSGVNAGPTIRPVA